MLVTRMWNQVFLNASSSYVAIYPPHTRTRTHHTHTSCTYTSLRTFRLVVLVESRAFVYNVADLSLLRTLETPPSLGSRQVSALSPCGQPNLMALPAASGKGTLRVYDLMVRGWPRGARVREDQRRGGEGMAPALHTQSFCLSGHYIA